MKIKLFFLTLLIIVTSCQGQDKKEKPKTYQKAETKGTNPKVDVKVNKKYDSKGNLIKFDSTYSYTYTSKGADSSKVRLDSITEGFKAFSNNNLTEKWNKEFKDIFMNDSLYKYDFPNEDYFSKRFDLNMARLQQMMKQMDSLKTSFLKEPPKPQQKRSLKK
jgi:hypothetical protein